MTRLEQSSYFKPTAAIFFSIDSFVVGKLGGSGSIFPF